MSVKRTLTAATWFRRCLKACKELRVRTGGRCEHAADGCGGVGYCDYCMHKANEPKGGNS